MADAEQMFAMARRIDGERAEELATQLSGSYGDGSRQLATAVLLGTAYPALLITLQTDPSVAVEPSPRSRGALSAAARELATTDGDDFRKALRRFARQERLCIALRELLPPAMGGADLEQTARELSELADVTIDSALDEAMRHVFCKLGTPRDDTGHPSKLAVLGMGKLGGHELNAGSDVDLVCFYDSDEHVAHRGDQQRSAHEVWSKVVQRMTGNLADATEDGIVWRVDLRLRPEGASGPLVNSLAAAERYYEVFGRLWERAAMLRARPVAGDLSFGKAVLQALEPFVWRKPVDPSIAVSMYELVHRARTELSSKSAALGGQRDLKLGPGGIREAEFFVQALQLIWGGREPRIRAKATLAAAQRLHAAGLVTEREATDLAAAYVALRRAEHAVQWASGQQTHRLPDAPDALARMARALGFATAADMSADLEAHTSRVSALLTSLLPSGEAPTMRWSDAILALDFGDVDDFVDALALAGMPEVSGQDHGQLARDLFEASRQHPDALLGARTRERWRHLADTLLSALADSADPTQAARYLRAFSARARPAGVYAKLLADNPAAVRRLVTVLGGSAFIGDAVASRSELADLVLFEHAVPTADEARAEVFAALLAKGDDPDEVLEAQISLLRRAKRRITTRVALADLADEIDTPGATYVLSELADSTLEVATRIVLDTPAGEAVTGLSVVAMGKLGGREIGYGSDLDVIFLFDPAGATSDDPIAYFSRRAQRIIQLISMPHPDGPGYVLDTRLRPSGSHGLLVVSLEAFARYHDVRLDDREVAPCSVRGERAATWERLALLRARFAAGDTRLGADAMGVAREAALRSGGSPASMAADVHRLRLRMERELAKEQPGRYDIKLGKGGLVDIEFAVQLLQLRLGDMPEAHHTDMRLAIEALARIGRLTPTQEASLREGYAFLRRLEQRLRIVHGDSSHLIEEHATGLLPLARRMGIRDRQDRAGASLIEQYCAISGRVRQVYEEVVVAAAESSAAQLPLEDS